MKRSERIDLAVYTRRLRRQAIWCGLVFALAALFCTLNALPPIPVKYEVTGKVLVEPQRVAGLVKNLRQITSNSDAVVLRDFQVLARSQSEPVSGFTKFHDKGRVFLTMTGLWNNRCSHEEFQLWAEQATRSEPEIHRDSQLASAVRKARWDLMAAEHYRSHHDFHGLPAEASSDGQELREIASGDGSVQGSNKFQLAGLESQRSSSHLVAGSLTQASSANVALGADVAESSLPSTTAADRRQLEANVVLAQQRLSDLESSVHQSMREASGTVDLIDPPRVIPVSDRIPSWMALSVIVILLAAGSLAAWYHLRLQSGGVYDPQEVASQLASQGMLVVAKVELPSDQIDSSDWLEMASWQASEAGRRTGRNLTYLSEAVLAFWCCLILARLAIDPLWRIVLWESPLAAFGRLMSGLP